jgi:hypothetical protein
LYELLFFFTNANNMIDDCHIVVQNNLNNSHQVRVIIMETFTLLVVINIYSSKWMIVQLMTTMNYR